MLQLAKGWLKRKRALGFTKLGPKEEYVREGLVGEGDK